MNEQKRTGPKTGKDFAVWMATQSDLTPHQIWEKSGKVCSMSHVYYVLRTKRLNCNKHNHLRQFKELAEIQAMDTASMTVAQVMTRLNLIGRTNYHRILNTMTKNSLPFIKVVKHSKYESRLLEMDTKNMTVTEIAAELGMTKQWQKSKLYPILKSIGLEYKKEK